MKEPAECIGALLSVAVTGIVYGPHAGILASDKLRASVTKEAADALSASYGVLGPSEEDARERAECGTRKANPVIESCAVHIDVAKKSSEEKLEIPDLKKSGAAVTEVAKE